MTVHRGCVQSSAHACTPAKHVSLQCTYVVQVIETALDMCLAKDRQKRVTKATHIDTVRVSATWHACQNLPAFTC